MKKQGFEQLNLTIPARDKAVLFAYATQREEEVTDIVLSWIRSLEPELYEPLSEGDG